MMAADCLEALGIARGDYVIKVNNRKVLDGVMEAIGLGGEANAGRRLTVLRAIDKLDRLGPEACVRFLASGRKDESGDFTKGADLTEQINPYRVLNLVSLSNGSSRRELSAHGAWQYEALSPVACRKRGYRLDLNIDDTFKHSEAQLLDRSARAYKN